MNLNDAIDIIKDYLGYNIDYDIDVLGASHPHCTCGGTIGKIQEAFELLEQFNFFNYREIEEDNEDV